MLGSFFKIPARCGVVVRLDLWHNTRLVCQVRDVGWIARWPAGRAKPGPWLQDLALDQGKPQQASGPAQGLRSSRRGKSQPMRIVIAGTCGSGKTTLAKALAAQLALPCIEIDALNWQPGWYDLSQSEPEEFTRQVSAAIAADSWVLDSAYSLVRDLAWKRATHLVWLDYSRSTIMFRVIRRSLIRAALRIEMWPGCRERWSDLLRASHPIRWAWRTHARRRKDFIERLARPDCYAHLVVLRLNRPRDAKNVLTQLAQPAVRAGVLGCSGWGSLGWTRVG
jgi:adenylate kinase family enzyme